jgi:hypothetical protein
MAQKTTDSCQPSHIRPDRNTSYYLTSHKSFEKKLKTKAVLWDEDPFTDENARNALEHSQKLIEISQKVACKYEKRFSKAKTKFVKDDEARKQRFSQTQGSMQKGVTQANGLENEIVKLIEARISLDQEHLVNEG